MAIFSSSQTRIVFYCFFNKRRFSFLSRSRLFCYTIPNNYSFFSHKRCFYISSQTMFFISSKRAFFLISNQTTVALNFSPKNWCDYFSLEMGNFQLLPDICSLLYLPVTALLIDRVVGRKREFSLFVAKGKATAQKLFELLSSIAEGCDFLALSERLRISALAFYLEEFA